MSRTPLTPDARAFLRRFGDAVRDARRAAGLLQEQLAARMDAAGQRIGSVERSDADTFLSRVFTIARALGVPLSVLVRRAEVAGMDERALDEIRDRIRAAVRRLSAADLDLVDAIVRRLAP